MRTHLTLVCLALVLACSARAFARNRALAQDENESQTTLKHRSEQQPTAQPSASATPTPAPSTLPEDASGMYAFLKEGEYLQISIGNGRLEGVLSVYGDSASDKGEFEDLLFDKTRLNGNTLAFTTKQIHGRWYEFTGTIVRGPDMSKNRGDEGYYVLKGTLTKNKLGPEGKTESASREVSLKSMPGEFGK